MPVKTGDITHAPPLLQAENGTAVLADKAYDSNASRTIIPEMSAKAVIPSNHCRKPTILSDAAAYKHPNRIKRCFGHLKHPRPFATRYDRRTIHSPVSYISPPPWSDYVKCRSASDLI